MTNYHFATTYPLVNGGVSRVSIPKEIAILPNPKTTLEVPRAGWNINNDKGRRMLLIETSLNGP